MARPLALLTLIAVPALASGAALVSPAPAALPLAPVAVQDPAREFRDQFDQALKLNSKSRMDELMRTKEDLAINLILVTAEGVSATPNEALLTRFEGLRESWKRVYDTKFPDKLERMFARMNAGTKRQRLALKLKYEELTRNVYEFQQQKNKAAIKAAAEQLLEMADGFKKMGDQWHEAQCLAWAAPSLDETYQGKDADLDACADAYARAIEVRKAIGVKDATYKGFTTRSKNLTGLGYGTAGAVKGGKAGAKATKGPQPAGDAVVAALEFEELKPLKDLGRPNYYLDEHRQIWPAVALKAPGSRAEIPRVDGAPVVIREGAAQIVLDADGDGKGDIDWPTKGKFENLVLELGSGDTKRKWAVLTEVGRQEDFYQGQPMNLLATDGQYLVYYIPGGCMKGTVSGETIRVYDDNLDGVYGSPASSWQHFGLVTGDAQFEFDSIRVGKEKKARPFSEYVDLGSAGWHQIKTENKGTSLSAQPVTLTTGSVQVKGKGVKPEYYVLRGVDDSFKKTFIDVSGGKKVDVPAGRWELAFGLVRKGKKMQQMKAVIQPTEGMERIIVKPGETTVIGYGSPYKFDFKFETDGRNVTVDGKTVRILGSGGEAYDRFYNCVPYVDVGVRRKGGKRANANMRMKPVVDNLGLEKHGWQGMWKPVTDSVPLKEAEVEVQLVEKKNKLFGKVESDWK